MSVEAQHAHFSPATSLDNLVVANCQSAGYITLMATDQPSAGPPALPLEIEAAVAQQHGGPVSIVGQHGSYVVMNADVYSGQMAGASTAEYADSIAAIKRSLAQASAGDLSDAEQFLTALGQTHES
jgi:hypothetical protein